MFLQRKRGLPSEAHAFFTWIILYIPIKYVHTGIMKIRDLMNESLVEVGAELYTKDEALDRLIELQQHDGDIRDALTLSREVREREQKGSSALSFRVAVPEVCHKGAQKTSVSAVTVRKGVDYGAPDKRPVRLIFLIAGKDGSDEYIEAKRRLTYMLSDMRFTSMLCAAKSNREFLRLIEEKENKIKNKN